MRARCESCDFDNPRRWVTCARCGALLGPQRRAPSIAAPEPDPASDAGADEDARTGLMPAPPRQAPAAPSMLDARPFVGQAGLLERVEEALHRTLRKGRAGLLLVTGEPGSGRSLALQRASELGVRADPRACVHYATCDSRDVGPYAPFSRLLLERFGVTPASAPPAVRGEMTTAVGEVLGPDGAARVSETSHLLGHLAGVPFPDSPFLRRAEREPGALHQDAAAALTRFVEGEARRRPQLWLLDNLDRADEPALALLRGLLDVDGPLLVIGTGKAALRERLSASLSDLAGERVLDAELAALSARDAGELVCSLVPGLRTAPPGLVRALMHRTAGNPGQLSTLVRVLQDAGLFRSTARGVEVDLQRLEAGSLPLTALEGARLRLDGLPAAERELMRNAAVVGERFWNGALLALQRAGEPASDALLAPLEIWSRSEDDVALSNALAALEAKGFIVRLSEASAPGLDEYTFQIAEARELLYDELEEAERMRRHRVVASWMAASSHLGVESLAAQVAPHLERGGQRERAARAYLSAATDERKRMRTTMALRYTDRALSLIDEDDVTRRMEALHGRGALLTVLGRYDEAYAAFHAVLRLSFRVGARGTGGAALNRLARIHRERGENDRALAHLRAALVLFRACDDRRGVASCFDDMAQVHRLRGDLERALSAAKEALDLRTRTRDRRGQALSLNTIGNIELDHGRYDSAEIRFRKALEIREALGDHEGAVQTRIALGRLAFQRGEVDEAIRLYRHALDSAREMDNRRFQSYLLSHLGEALIARSELDHAADALREARELAAGMRDQRVLVDIERNRGLLSQSRGERAQ